jgi:hypothetical protein
VTVNAIGAALTCAIGLGIVSSCGGGGEKQEPVIAEVDGVVHVRLPSRDLSDAPAWRFREIYRTSASGSGIELFRVVGARFLDDGTLVIANSGTRELLYLDGAGGLARKFGQVGRGPGEFSMMSALDVDGSGNLIVYDPREMRLTRVTSTGDFLETQRLSSEDAVVDLYPLSELADGRILAVFGDVRVFGGSGESRDTVPLVVVDPSAARWDTLGIWPAQEWANFEFAGGVTRAEVGFGRRLAYSGRGGPVAVGSTDSLNLTVFDGTGRLAMQIAGWGSSEDVGADDVDRWRTELLDRRSQAPEEIRRWLSNTPCRDTYPAFDGLLMDDRARVWVGMFPRAGESQGWLVLGADGRLEAQFTLPSGSRLLDAAGDHVALLRRNALDEEYVVVMAVEQDG